MCKLSKYMVIFEPVPELTVHEQECIPYISMQGQLVRSVGLSDKVVLLALSCLY